MQLRALRYFHEVAKHASLRQAADRLFVTPSAVSRQIEQLEHFYGTSLLERSPTGVRLTYEGEFLAQRVEAALKNLDEVRDVIALRRSEVAGEVRIATSESLVATFIAPILQQIKSSNPKVSFKVEVGCASKTVEQVATGTADIGLNYFVKDRAEVSTVATCKVSHGVVLAKDHRLAHQKTISLSDLEGESVTVSDAEFGLRRAFELATKSSGVKIETCFTANSLEVQKSLARASASVIILPETAISRVSEADSLRWIPISDVEFGTIVAELFVSRNRNPTVAAKVCVEMLANTLTRYSGALYS